MKAVLLLCLLAGSAVARTLDEELRQWNDFKDVYGRHFQPSEDVHRFECFRRNLALIDERNARPGAQHGVNQFADLCPEEFAAKLLGYRPRNVTTSPINVAQSDASSVDWRAKGAVTPIKNQGMCGSCWSFSSTGNMEGQWFLSGKTLVGLSEEELVQCDHTCFGCNGGWMDKAFEWVAQNGGIDSESDYPYTSGTGVTGQCDQSKTSNKVAHFASHVDLPHTEDAMASWCAANGPVSIAVDALTWQTYSGGVMSDCDGRQLDHGVLIVGFDKTANPPYWIVKNSWGTMWGMSGYIKLEYGTDQCGLTSVPCSARVQ